MFLSAISFAETYAVRSLEARCWKIRRNFSVVAEVGNERGMLVWELPTCECDDG